MEIIKTGWEFFQNQILGMQWLKDLIGKLLVKAGLGEGRFPGEFLHFFLYDIIKIFVLLAVLIFVISYIQSYFPPERSRKIMGRFHGIWANLIGALLGTVTPFCSCSSIPIFMGFTSAGLPLGVTFSFLISSPMVDLGSLVLLMSVFGGKIAFAYISRMSSESLLEYIVTNSIRALTSPSLRSARPICSGSPVLAKITSLSKNAC